MSAPTVRSDYDQLKNISQSFSSQADNLNQMIQNINSNVDTLQGGDWIGQGAQAFFKEMNETVFPTPRRLTHAMSESARITQQIAQVMHDAEDSAAGVFHL